MNNEVWKLGYIVTGGRSGDRYKAENSTAAVISETGGAASHAAIVACEYGLPAVLAIDGATQILRDGQPVEVDGDRGTVTLLSSK